MFKMNWIYLAGFFDGEGCISLFKSKVSKYKKYELRPTLFLTNTNKEIMKQVYNLIKV